MYRTTAALCVLLLATVQAWAPTCTVPATRRAVVLGAKTNGPEQLNRRDAALAALAFVSGTTSWSLLPAAAGARGGPATPAELARIKTGYDRLVAFLNDFDAQTTVCKPECERAPDAVRGYLGLRSTTDPLFQIEKVFSKAQDNLDDIDELEKYIDATEAYTTAVAESNSLSYTSSFGEYNPGGGKDEVEKYLQKSKIEAIKAKDALKEIIDILKIT